MVRVLLKYWKIIIVNADTDGSIESVQIKHVEFRENIKAFFPQGQSKCP